MGLFTLRSIWSIVASQRTDLGSLAARSGLIVALNLVSQLVAIGSALLMTRLYRPEDLVIYSVLIGAMNILGLAACARADQFFMVARDSLEASKYIKLGVAMAVAFGLTTSVGLQLIFAGGIGGVADLDASAAGELVGLAVALSGFLQILQAALVRMNRISTFAAVQVLQSVLFCVLVVAFGILGWSYDGPPAAALLSMFACVVVQFYCVRMAGNHLQSGPEINGPSAINARGVAMATLAAVVNGLSQPYLLLMLGPLYFAAGDVGLLSVAVRVVLLPSIVVGNTLMQLFLGRYSESVRLKRRCAIIVKQFTCLGVVLGLLLLFGGATVIPLAVQLFLSQEWSGVSGLAISLLPFAAAQLVVRPIGQTLGLLGKQAYYLAWEVSRLIAVVAVLFVAIRYSRPLVEVSWLVSMVHTFFYLVLVLMILREAKNFDGKILGAVEDV